MKIFHYTISVLIVFTLMTAVFSGFHASWAVWGVLVFSAAKFLLVSFNFMEMRHAHPLWKTLLVTLSVIFVLVFGFLIA